MDKFDRRYELLYVRGDGVAIDIRLPFSIDIQIMRNNFASSNIGKLRLFNLSKNNRELIRRDWDNFDLRDRVILKAGYGDNLSTIMDMNVSKAFSVHDGVDFITEIECLDGGYAYLNAQIEKTFPSGTPIREMIIDIAESLEKDDVQLGVVGSFPGTLQKSESFAGNPLEILRELTGGAAFVDNGKINILKDNEAIKGEPLLINSQSGLLTTPVRQEFYVEFEMIFDPQLVIGKTIQLDSTRGDIDINQEYIINYLSHRGMISESVKGTMVTEVGCLPGNFVKIGTSND